MSLLVAAGVLAANAGTDAVYVTTAVAASHTNNWHYVGFASAQLLARRFASMAFFHRAPSHPPPPLAPMAD